MICLLSPCISQGAPSPMITPVSQCRCLEEERLARTRISQTPSAGVGVLACTQDGQPTTVPSARTAPCCAQAYQGTTWDLFSGARVVHDGREGGGMPAGCDLPMLLLPPHMLQREFIRIRSWPGQATGHGPPAITAQRVWPSGRCQGCTQAETAEIVTTQEAAEICTPVPRGI